MMRAPTLLKAGFEAAAVRRFEEQFNGLHVYRRYCEARAATADTVNEWRAIPLMPVTAFKTAVLQSEAAARAPTRVFETSGTTDGRPGTVRLSDLRHYDAALHACFEHFMLPDEPGPMRCISLVPGPEVSPRSSLGYMVGQLVSRHGDGEGRCYIGSSSDEQGAIDVHGLLEALLRAVSDGVPALIFATTIACDMAMRAWPSSRRLRLPAGSRLMDTGGSKGRQTQVDRGALRQQIAQRWGIAPALFVGELGMTELASQRYETTLRAALIGDVSASRAYAGPPWLRSVILDPMTMRQQPVGEPGIVGHLDLANVQTCAFILTSDIGRMVPVTGAGHCLELLGRAPGSAFRGCGLDVELL